ncbi:MAG: UDP-3-O-(3-hydroxymyristoyl)glucosamine N-acyltransferase [Paracoccaceae bacterium]|nr:UDP-3-O-(3-hydroxymyristoyl)glucosamine N-acyltransferase [Paracoccaceae bacterium]
MMFSLQEISEYLSMTLVGDGTIPISGPSEPRTAKKNQLALAMDEKFLKDVKLGDAKAALLLEGSDWKDLNLEGALFVKRSRYAVAQVNKLFEEHVFEWVGVHDSAIVSENAELEENVSIGPFSVINSAVKIKKNAKIGSHVFISKGVIIGQNATIHSGVKIGPNVVIGDDLICHPNAVIGADGFSFVSPEGGGVEQARKAGDVTGIDQIDHYVRIASLGSVIIGNDVEIGAGSVIDRGTISNTRIGNGTKLDNLVHIAHNVSIGDNCLLCGQVGIAGSVTIGDRVVLGGQVGVADHISIGCDSIVAGKSGVSSNVPKGRFMMGNPAMKMKNNIDSYKVFRRLPTIIKKIQHLEQVVIKKID